MKKFLKTLTLAAIAVSMTGCAMFESLFGEAKENLIGVGFTIETYDNYGELTMTSKGTNISLAGNRTREVIVTDEGYGYKYELSSVMTITIDDHEMESCGDTLIFAEDGLEKIVDFTIPEFVESNNQNPDPTLLAYTINNYENLVGKSRVVVIKSQMGQPLCAYQGDKVYWEVPERLPKTTRLMIDGKALYIHRANFQIIDTELLSN